MQDFSHQQYDFFQGCVLIHELSNLRLAILSSWESQIPSNETGPLWGPATSKWDLWWSFRCALRKSLTLAESCLFFHVYKLSSCPTTMRGRTRWFVSSTCQFFWMSPYAHCYFKEMPPTHWWKTWWRFCRTVLSWGLNEERIAMKCLGRKIIEDCLMSERWFVILVERASICFNFFLIWTTKINVNSLYALVL